MEPYPSRWTGTDLGRYAHPFLLPFSLSFPSFSLPSPSLFSSFLPFSFLSLSLFPSLSLSLLPFIPPSLPPLPPPGVAYPLQLWRYSGWSDWLCLQPPSLPLLPLPPSAQSEAGHGEESLITTLENPPHPLSTH